METVIETTAFNKDILPFRKIYTYYKTEADNNPYICMLHINIDNNQVIHYLTKDKKDYEVTLIVKDECYDIILVPKTLEEEA